MNKFLYLEGGYLILGSIVLLVTLFVVTRPFMGKNAKKYGFSGVFLFLSFAIGAHYIITTNRMQEVKEAFLNNKKVICESRMIRKGAQSIIIQKSTGWRLDGDFFVSKAYVRPFFTARCIKYEKK